MSLKQKLLGWCLQHLEEAREDGLTDLVNMYDIGEVNTTILTDELIHDSGLIPENEIEDAYSETHDVYEVVIDAAEEYERKHSPWLRGERRHTPEFRIRRGGSNETA